MKIKFEIEIETSKDMESEVQNELFFELSDALKSFLSMYRHKVDPTFTAVKKVEPE